MPATLRRVLHDVDGPVVLLLNKRTQISPWRWVAAFGRRLHVFADPEVRRWPGVRWVEVTGRRAIAEQLLRTASCAAIVDEVAVDPTKQLERWFRFGLHLRPGGRYSVRSDASPEQWLTLVTEHGDFPTVEARQEFTSAAAAVMPAAGRLLLPKQHRHLLKITEREADSLLPQRESGLRVSTVATRAAVHVESLLTVFSHGPEGVAIPRPSFEAPRLICRWYQGPVQVRSHLLTISGDTVLPPSFRHAWGVKPRNAFLLDAGGGFAAPRPLGPITPLVGDYFDLNAAVPGHFGHVMTESIAKLWAWEEARARVPGIKGLYRLPDGASQPTFERALFEAYGLGDDQVHWASGDVAVTSYVSPTMPWHNGRPHHFHPVVQEVWARLRGALVRSEARSPERVFASRDRAARTCRNQPEVDAWFARRGFTVVYPERLSIPEQATLFGNARVVAGFGGSAMFNALFAEHLDKLIVLTHDKYVARNEWLFGAALADELHYFWAEPDLHIGPETRWRQVFHSAWAFDFERFGSELDAALS